MKILVMIAAGVAAVLVVGVLLRKKPGGRESERRLSDNWEGADSEGMDKSDG